MFSKLDLEKTGLSQQTILDIRNCLSNFSEIEQAVLYGSRAKGNYKNGSDIDLTLVGKSLSLDILFRVDLALDDLLTLYSFGLSIYENIDNPALIDHINRVGMVLFQKKMNLLNAPSGARSSN